MTNAARDAVEDPFRYDHDEVGELEYAAKAAASGDSANARQAPLSSERRLSSKLGPHARMVYGNLSPKGGGNVRIGSRNSYVMDEKAAGAAADGEDAKRGYATDGDLTAAGPLSWRRRRKRRKDEEKRRKCRRLLGSEGQAVLESGRHYYGHRSHRRGSGRMYSGARAAHSDGEELYASDDHDYEYDEEHAGEAYSSGSDEEGRRPAIGRHYGRPHRGPNGRYTSYRHSGRHYRRGMDDYDDDDEGDDYPEEYSEEEDIGASVLDVHADAADRLATVGDSEVKWDESVFHVSHKTTLADLAGEPAMIVDMAKKYAGNEVMRKFAETGEYLGEIMVEDMRAPGCPVSLVYTASMLPTKSAPNGATNVLRKPSRCAPAVSVKFHGLLRKDHAQQQQQQPYEPPLILRDRPTSISRTVMDGYPGWTVHAVGQDIIRRGGHAIVRADNPIVGLMIQQDELLPEDIQRSETVSVPTSVVDAAESLISAQEGSQPRTRDLAAIRFSFGRAVGESVEGLSTPHWNDPAEITDDMEGRRGVNLATIREERMNRPFTVSFALRVAHGRIVPILSEEEEAEAEIVGAEEAAMDSAASPVHDDLDDPAGAYGDN